MWCDKGAKDKGPYSQEDCQAAGLWLSLSGLQEGCTCIGQGVREEEPGLVMAKGLCSPWLQFSSYAKAQRSESSLSKLQGLCRLSWHLPALILGPF